MSARALSRCSGVFFCARACAVVVVEYRHRRCPHMETDSRTKRVDEVRWWRRTRCRRRLEEWAFSTFLLMHRSTLLLVLYTSALFRMAGACSSRSTPRPRPPPTMRPNITFQTYACPEAYAKWYCLNGATCFSVKIGESILYNCECAEGFVGQRCEFKDLEGSYLASRQQVMIETASIAGGVTLLILIVVIISVALYAHYKKRQKEQMNLVTPASRACQPFGSFRDTEEHVDNEQTTEKDPESGTGDSGKAVSCNREGSSL